ncbi:MAG: 3-hydroxy-3-methylglutaryl CoA synthase, partial [Chloroflexota bacterium]|nr:3-hydroxy-3-methylglutaryl CoA synthase [Chloroflexota bacterium]
MAGIKSCGAYIPLWRLSRDTVSAAWGGRSLGGERSVANWDEDSLTMATEAAFNCISGLDRQGIGSVYFASTTAPYKEKQCAAIIASALDLSNEVFSVDFSNSLRSGTNALRAAIAAANGGSEGDILLVASDVRLGTPRTPDEQTFGDGAAAILIGSGGVAVEIERMHSVSADIADVWRKDGDTFVQSWEDRWVMLQGYTRNMKAAISSMMKKQGLSPKDFAKVVLYSPDAKSHLDIARSLGFDPKEQVQEPLIGQAGNLG